jgi:predicted Fe-Mo cluster-binding NifX family protein
MDTKYIKIAICANDTNPESNVSSRFARCEYYALYNHETLDFTFHKNIAKDEMSGAGGKAAKQVSELGAEVVLVPEVGPKAFDALEAFEVGIYRYKKDYSVRDAIYDFYDKKLNEVLASTKKGKH